MKFGIDLHRIKETFSGKNKTKFLFIIGIAGMLLILLSELIPDKETANQVNESQSAVTQGDETELYKQQIQTELTELLTKIQGVGDCKVMVTVEGTTEYVYAENISRYNDTDNERVSDKYENNIVFTEKDGEKQALVKKIIKPQINGVVVVCEGGGNVQVSERVIKAVSTALNLSSGKICVEEKIH
ncbi:MAG: stage III sporulation protein AG [Ruminococcus sp.]|nr:stage III sporulation protein AG [Ruminococcus sp.]